MLYAFVCALFGPQFQCEAAEKTRWKNSSFLVKSPEEKKSHQSIVL